MELLIEALLWFGMICGSFALLRLVSEGVGRFSEAFDTWVESIVTHYLDDL